MKTGAVRSAQRIDGIAHRYDGILIRARSLTSYHEQADGCGATAYIARAINNPTTGPKGPVNRRNRHARRA